MDARTHGKSADLARPEGAEPSTTTPLTRETVSGQNPPAPDGDPCPRCEGDGYLESWNDDHSDVLITLCPDCGPAPGDFDG